MIEFVNVRTGERRKITTEPMLSAFYNSSDQGPNSHEGQDFGWRLAPETVKRIREIKSDRALLDHIKSSFELADEVKEIDILYYISTQESREEKEELQSREQDYARKYEDDIRALDDDRKPAKPASRPSTQREKPAGNQVPDEIEVDPADTYPLNQVKSAEKPEKSKTSNSAKKTDSAKIEGQANQEN